MNDLFFYMAFCLDWLFKSHTTIALLFAFTVVEGGRKQPQGVENRLIHDLLSGYSRYGRPIKNVSNTIVVHQSFYLTQLMSLEEKHQVLTTFGWLETSWQDDFLTWDPRRYKGMNRLVLSPELVWLPDFGVENSAQAIYEEIFFKRFRVAVTNEGRVTWVPGGKFVTSCQLDITFYPFDDQQCHIDFVDWAYNGLEVDLQNSSSVIGLDAYAKSGEWEVTSTQVVRSNNYYESDPGVPFPRIRFSLYLKRKPMFYLINIITPCFTMSLLAVLVFYLPPDSGEKVSLGITVLLSFSVFLLLVAENVPKTSEFVPLIGIYLTLIMAMTAASILICVVVLNLHHRKSNAPVPHWLKYITFHLMAHVVCMRTQVRHALENNSKLPEPEHQKNERTSHTQPKPSFRHNDLCNNLRRVRKNTIAESDMLFMNMYNDSAAHRNGLCNNLDYSNRIFDTGKKKELIQEILKHIRQITSKMQESEAEEVLQADWKLVAKILDRFFLYVFIILVVLSSTIMLVIYPLFQRSLHT